MSRRAWAALAALCASVLVPTASPRAHGFFRDDAHMAEASVTRIVASAAADALTPVWVGQPEMDDNVPAAITDAFVEAYERAGGLVEHSHFPGARHGFMQNAGSASGKGVALMRDFVGHQLGSG